MFLDNRNICCKKVTRCTSYLPKTLFYRFVYNSISLYSGQIWANWTSCYCFVSMRRIDCGDALPVNNLAYCKL